MQTFEPHKLLDQNTGAIDWTYLRSAANRAARRDFDGAGPPPAIVRSWIENYKGIALGLRDQWRRSRSLPAEPLVPGFQVIEPWYRTKVA
jgi:hypothetical protein